MSQKRISSASSIALLTAAKEAVASSEALLERRQGLMAGPHEEWNPRENERLELVSKCLQLAAMIAQGEEVLEFAEKLTEEIERSIEFRRKF